jgi:hypothetical protein
MMALRLMTDDGIEIELDSAASWMLPTCTCCAACWIHQVASQQSAKGPTACCLVRHEISEVYVSSKREHCDNNEYPPLPEAQYEMCAINAMLISIRQYHFLIDDELLPAVPQIRIDIIGNLAVHCDGFVVQGLSKPSTPLTLTRYK